MPRRLRVLVVGTGSDELEALRGVAAGVVTGSSELLALDVPRGSSDPGMAWGVRQAQLHRFCSTHEGGLGPPAAQPLGDDGDVWKAIVDAVAAHDVDVIVIASLRQSWFRRLFAGSATHDLLANADVPVLAVPEAVFAPSSQESADCG